jgi:tetrahedral aminopeptidase
MDARARKFLDKLLLTPSPTGSEVAIQKVIREEMSSVADVITSDVHGNLIVALAPKNARRVMLAGHCDQIGFMVKHVSADGFLYVSALGGIDPGVLPGAMVHVLSQKGVLKGVFGRKPIHMQSADERSRLPLDLDKMWIDLGCTSKKQVEKLGVAIGDSVVFEPRISELSGGFVVSPALDDKVGVFVVMEALRQFGLRKRKNSVVALFAVSTVQEEVGLRGARTSSFSIDPEVGIAVDVAHATDNPAADGGKYVPLKLGIGPGIGKGPTCNPVVERLLTQAAKTKKIPHQALPSSAIAGNDAAIIQLNRSGVASGIVAIPNRYMHTQGEVCCLDDLTNSVEILVSFLLRLTTTTSFIPQ